MKKILVLIGVFINFSCQQPAIKYDIIIDDITIIDVENAQLIPNQTICINQNRIERISKTTAGEKKNASQIINGKGKFIVPGFWDMHAHVCWKDNLDEKLFPIFLSYGITGLRDMGGSLNTLNTFKQKAKNNPWSSPTLIGSGPILDGENPIHPSFSVSITMENYKQVLDSLVDHNVDFFKVYSLLPNDVLERIADYANQKQIRFSGHISEFVTPEMASELGQNSFEHLNGLDDIGRDSIRLQNFAELTKKNKNWFCPTLIIYQRKYELANNNYFHQPIYDRLDEDLKLEWQQEKVKNKVREQIDIKDLKNDLDRQKKLVKTLYEKQVPFLLGTDFAGMPFIYPGYSFHEEMKMLQDIGIPRFEILKMATLNPAIYLGITESYGTIEEGKVADLLILNANPVSDIINTLSIDVVVKSGRVVK